MRQIGCCALLSVLSLAGCGGGGSTDYSLDRTAACLDGADGVTAVSTNDDDQDAIAAGAPGGAVRAEVGENEVHVAFGRTEDEADEIKS